MDGDTDTEVESAVETADAGAVEDGTVEDGIVEDGTACDAEATGSDADDGTPTTASEPPRQHASADTAPALFVGVTVGGR